MDAMPPPLPSYLPKGFFLFKARGSSSMPMAPKKDWYIRRQTRQEEKKAKNGRAGTDGGLGDNVSLGAKYRTERYMAIIFSQLKNGSFGPAPA
eukprot:scaffold783_cov217-Skeletonema_menzelii.AAC.3